MVLPGTSIGTATDEAALSLAIQTLAAANGWTVTAAGTTPANSRWFQSSGSDGCRNLVAGLIPDTTARTMRAFVAADLDTTALVAANVGGYTNNDASGGQPAPIQPETALTWPARQVGQTYTYLIAASADAVACLVNYVSGGSNAQGLIYLGGVEMMAGRFFQTQAKAFIDTVGAGSNADQRLITLDRDITAMLKDTGAGGATYVDDPAQQTLFFQVIGGPASDFAQVERRQIVPGTLATAGGVTTFEVNTNAGAGTSKLFRSTQRYAANRGAGDIVRMAAEPTIAMCGASTNGSINTFTSSSATVLAPWDAFGGQGNPINVSLYNPNVQQTNSEAPDPTTNRTPWYGLYGIIINNFTNILTQSDGQGLKNIGRLYNLIALSNQSQPNYSFFRINSDSAQRYRVIQKVPAQGLGAPNGFTTGANNITYAVGPGW